MNKKTFGAGVLLCFIAAVMPLSSMRVTNFAFYRFGSVSTGGVFLVLFVLALIWVIVRATTPSFIAMALVVIGAFVSLLLGTRFYFVHISALSLILMVGLAAVGAGLIVKSLLGREG